MSFRLRPAARLARHLTFMLGAALAASAAQAAGPARIVTLGGSVTEIVYALGQGARLVGDDLSSMYPEAAQKLPRVGYYRAVPVEGVLALQPDLVLASEQAGPPSSLKKLADLGVQVETVSDSASIDSLKQRITQIAAALDVPAEGEKLTRDVQTRLDAAVRLPAANAPALLLLGNGGVYMGAGGGTAADLLLREAGLRNVLHDQKSYKPVSAEALSALAPAVIVVTQTTGQAPDAAALRALPGVAATPAGTSQCVVGLDPLLALGNGPRLPDAIRQLKETPCVAALARERTR